MKMWRYLVFFSAIAFLIAVVIAFPEWLSGNEFLKSAIYIDLLSLLVVILTITFASVANIHLTLNRLLEGAKPSVNMAAAEVRTEIDSNAWVLFGAFVICVIAMLFGGAMAENSTGKAIAFAICLLVLLLNFLVLNDIYQSIFALTSLDLPQRHKSQADDEKPDFNG